MKRIFLVLSLIIGLTELTVAQYVNHVSPPDTTKTVIKDSSDLSYRYAQTITNEDLARHLYTLASDKYEGREAGTKANDLAAGYIANHFKSIGLPAIGIENTFYQGVAFNRTSWSENSININGNPYRHLWDYMAFANINDDLPNLKTEEVVFLGFGIDDPNYSDYKGSNVKGKVIMINKGEPFSEDSISYVTGTNKSSSWDNNVWKKLKTAQKHGVKMVLVIENEMTKFLGENRRFLVSPSLQLGDGQITNREYANHIYISSAMARDIIGKKENKIKKWRDKNRKKGKTCDIKLKPELYIDMKKDISVIKGYNVLGFVEGTDKKDEVVIVSAHFDHLGKRGNDIYNGADDNASGTCTVLEMAEAMARAKSEGHGPRRRILFLLVTG
ncbi:MAG: M28 family peptidase, partial [Bacteroidia bacterium]|nr:M28 family peptidase [Bacteroidia bacterium]